MLSFELEDSHKDVEKAVRDWAAKEVAPKIHDLDREHRFERTVESYQNVYSQLLDSRKVSSEAVLSPVLN